MDNSKLKKVKVTSSDIPPVLFVHVLLALQVIGFIWVDSILGYILFYLFTTPLLTFSVAYGHHHAHVPFSNMSLLNRYVNRILSLQIWIGYYAWVMHHNIGHHRNYLNQYPLDDVEKLDESNWSRPDGTVMGRIEYTLHLAKTSNERVRNIGEKHPNLYKKYQKSVFRSYMIYAAIFLLNPLGGVFCFILPALTMSLFTFWITHPHHSGLKTDNPLLGSRNNVNRLYNIWFTNLGYHTAHHMHPYLHWSLLPQYHKDIEAKIPDRLKQETLFPW